MSANKSVYKYILTVDDEQTIYAPADAEFLHLAVQFGEPCLWALVNREAPTVAHLIHTRGTGHAMNGADSGKHIGTYMLHDGAFVGHVFIGAHD